MRIGRETRWALIFLMDGLQILLCIIVAIIILATLVLLIITPFQYIECHQHSKTIDNPVKFKLIAGCYVLMDDSWIPLARWIHMTE